MPRNAMSLIEASMSLINLSTFTVSPGQQRSPIRLYELCTCRSVGGQAFGHLGYPFGFLGSGYRFGYRSWPAGTLGFCQPGWPYCH